MNEEAKTAKARLLCCSLRELVDSHRYAEACLLRDQINECLSENAHEVACAEMAYVMSKCMSATCNHIVAMYYAELAYELENKLWQQEIVRANTAGESIEGGDMQAKVSLVCRTLGRTHSALGEYKTANEFFERSVALCGNAAHTHLIMPCFLELAQNMHALERHTDAIELLGLVVRQLAREDGEYDRSAYQFTICPTLLLGRCHVALGKYGEAVHLFMKARVLAKDQINPHCMGNAEINLAMTLWAKQVCLDRWQAKIAASFRNDTFVGPPLSHRFVEKHVIQFAARVCASNGGLAGSIRVCIQLNGHGDAIGVRMAVAGPMSGFRELMQIEWDQVEPHGLDGHGVPVYLILGITTDSEEPRMFNCRVQGAFISSELTDFLRIIIETTQGIHPDTSCDFLPLVHASLRTALLVASAHKIFDLYEDSTIFIAFFLFAQGDAHKQDVAVNMVKECVKTQIDNSRLSGKKRGCRFCFQQSEEMLLCGGCKVVRFCDKKHQKLASYPAFGSVSLPHKMLCPLLELYRSIRKHESRVTGDASGDSSSDSSDDFPDDSSDDASDDSATMTQLLIAYDEAVRLFLQRDILARYVRMHDYEGDFGEAPQ